MEGQAKCEAVMRAWMTGSDLADRRVRSGDDLGGGRQSDDDHHFAMKYEHGAVAPLHRGIDDDGMRRSAVVHKGDEEGGGKKTGDNEG